MSLRHALLAILTVEPMTGYDLVKYFDGTVAFVWSAPHSQIYPELRRMEADGLVEATVVPRGQRAQKRVYEITETGVEELRRWVGELHLLEPERDPARLQAVYFEWSTYALIRRQLQEHLNHYTAYRDRWQRFLGDIDARQVALLQRRLKRASPAQQPAIAAFKRFAFEGEVARAEAEIRWAAAGLELLDHLESSGVQLVGESPLTSWLASR